MKSHLWAIPLALMLSASFLLQCASATAPAPETIVETVEVKVVETVEVKVVETKEVKVVEEVTVVETKEVEVIVTATPEPVSGEVTAFLIGVADEDSLDPITGAEIPGTKKLKEAFEAAHPNITLNVIASPWGSGATSYSAKTESLIQAQEGCIYMMPGAFDYGRRGYLVNLDTLIENDPTFEDVWAGDYLEQWRGWGPGNPDNQWALPYRGDNRVIHWDAKLFEDWGVEPLNDYPTLEEIEEKAAAMTGVNPVTGEQNYGYWFQGQYAVWQFMAIAHAVGAEWGNVNDDGSWTVTWNTPQMLEAMEWFVKLAQYAPPGAVAADAMPEGFLTDQNVVAIIPEGEPGYYLQPILSDPNLAEHFRVSYNLKGEDDRGGAFVGSPLAMAASCPNKEAAWIAMKWLAGSPESMLFNFQAVGNLPVTAEGADVIPGLKDLPGNEAEIIVNQNATADAYYPWAASEPRWAMQAALEAALAGTLSPQEALEQAQTQTDAWLAEQQKPSE
jgi:ABC-type glycerol-3-phosphate transport system substrate-binding protein